MRIGPFGAPVWVLLAATVMVAAAGCGGTSGAPATGMPGSASASPGAARERAAQVAGAWPGSELERVWRSGYYPLDAAKEWLPKDAFHNGDDKLAYARGQIDVRAALPAYAPTAEVVWQDGSRLALPLRAPDGVLRAATGGGGVPCAGLCEHRLTVTAVRLTTREVPTSRGPATVPVWELTVAGYPDPFTYPAVAPQQPPLPSYAPLSPAPGAGVPVSWSGVSADGLTLDAVQGGGACEEPLPGEVYETDQAVVMIGRSRSTATPGQACAAVLIARPVTFQLTRPLGNRTVLDLSTGAPQAMDPARPPLVSAA